MLPSDLVKRAALALGLWACSACGASEPAPAPERTPVWAHSFDVTSGSVSVRLASDGAGTVYAWASWSQQPLLLDGTTLLPTVSGQAIVGFDQDGAPTFVKGVKGVRDVAGGAAAGVAVLGICLPNQPCEFDVGGDPLDDASLFVGALGANGEPTWVRSFSTTAGQLGTIECCEVAAAADGSVVVAGELKGTIDFGGGPLASDAEGDLFVTAFDAAGQLRWSRILAEPAGVDPAMLGIDVDAGGGVVLLGLGHGGLDFGGGILPAGLFLAELDAAGAHVRSRSLGGVEFLGRSSISVSRDAAGDLAFTARVLGGAVSVGELVADSGQLAVAVLDPTWNLSWGRAYGGLPAGRAVLDPGGELFVAATSDDPLFDDISYPSDCCDYFAARLGTDGGHRWSTGFVETISEEGAEVVRAGAGVAVAGNSAGPVDFRDGRSPLAAGAFVASFPP